MTNLALRDRRHQQAKKEFCRLERQRDDTLDKLARIAAKLKATRRSIERYERTPTLPAARPAASVKVDTTVETDHLSEPAFERLVERMDKPTAATIDLEIPGFLKRAGSIATMTPADLQAVQEIEAEQANKKRTKARVRIEKMKAKASGETRKMPLTGKAALEKIRAG
jgi:hypothetical protein